MIDAIPSTSTFVRTGVLAAVAVTALVAGWSQRPAVDRASPWDLELKGWPRRYSSATARISNPTKKMRSATIAIPRPTCKTARFSLQVTDPRGNVLYEGPPTCEPIVAWVRAGEFVDVEVSGNGEYELALSLR